MRETRKEGTKASASRASHVVWGDHGGVLPAEARTLLKDRAQQAMRNKFFVVAAAAVALLTVYLLMQPAVAASKVLACELDEHTHSVEDGCYQLVCQQEEGDAHSHSLEDGCYELTCETPEHTHSDSCYVAADKGGEESGAESDAAESSVVAANAAANSSAVRAASVDENENEGAGDEGTGGEVAGGNGESGGEGTEGDANQGDTADKGYIEIDSAEKVDSFYLWLKLNNSSHEALYENPKWENGRWNNLIGIIDALSYTENGQTYYLIPISYFIETYNYDTYGYQFNPEDPEACPFKYAPNASYPTSNLTAASYVLVQDKTSNNDPNAGWYVRVQDTGSYGNGEPPRSNIYLSPYRMWLWLVSEDGELSDGAISGQIETYNYVREENNTYLIPVDFLEQKLKDSLANKYSQEFASKYGYEFDASSIGTCPFQYSPDANANKSNLTTASYVNKGGAWYIRVQDRGTYGDPPRNNIFYILSKDEIESFSLTTWVKNTADSGSVYNKTNAAGSVNIKDALWSQISKKYLIPVSDLQEAYKEYGYKFESDNTDICPFTYVTGDNVTNMPNNPMRAEYVYLKSKANNVDSPDGEEDAEGDDTSGWYVRIKADAGSDNTPPSGNIYYVTTVKDAVSPTGTVINLFDYWVTEKIEDDVTLNDKVTTEKNYVKGINSNHVLKFKPTGLKEANAWTETANPYSDIVNSVLTDGYPTLSDKQIFGIETDETVSGSEYATSGTTESLSYLFDPDSSYDTGYRDAYRNVKGLLQVDESGYYYYDSKKNFAEFNEASNSFTLYNDWAVTYTDSSNQLTEGQFFPFDSYNKLDRSANASDGNLLNHYFGMTLTARFIQQYGGHVDFQKNTDMVFEFSGDDDVWIFIDDVLVADLGGIHNAASVKIDFSTGNVDINGSASTTIKKMFEEAGMSGKESDWNGNTFADDTTHTLKFFYLERGSYASNCSLKYNLKEIPESSIIKVDQYGESVANAQFALYAAKKIDSTSEEGAVGEGSSGTEGGASDESGSDNEGTSNEGGSTEEGTGNENNSDEEGSASVNGSPGNAISELFKVLSGASGLNYRYMYQLDLQDGDTDPIYVSLDDITYDIAASDSEVNGTIIKKGTITITSGDHEGRTITPIYYGITDEDGKMTFVDEDGVNLALADLKTLAGGTEHFILREVVIPDGYRVISDEVWLYLQGSVLYCDNVYSSGAWASASVQINATSTIYLDDMIMLVDNAGGDDSTSGDGSAVGDGDASGSGDANGSGNASGDGSTGDDSSAEGDSGDAENGGEDNSGNNENSQTGTSSGKKLNAELEKYPGVVSYNENTGKVSVNYYDPAKGESSENGKLFAVVLKYKGEAGNVADLEKTSSWVPLYGNGIDGFTTVNTSNGGGTGAGGESSGDATGSGSSEGPGSGANVGAVDERTAFLKAVIETARTMESNEAYSNSVFEMSGGGSMQLLLSDLPGSLNTYYSMLLKSYSGATDGTLNDYLAKNVNYTVAYYWTTAKSLEDATPANTFRVNPYAFSGTDSEAEYGGFERAFAANIEVPNLVNRLFVQKFDDSGRLVDGATFAMYAVGQDEGSRDFYYLADSVPNTDNGDGSSNSNQASPAHIYLKASDSDPNVGEAWVSSRPTDEGGSSAAPYTYKIDKTSGLISVYANNANGSEGSSGSNGSDAGESDGNEDSTLKPSYTITPVETQVTRSDTIAGENGTAVFGHRNSKDGGALEDGCYVVREIAAPEDYLLNASEIQVLVDNTAIYANAGTADDGVTVARGPGYVASTLQKFASYGDLDNTLTWVYEQLLVSDVTTKFSDAYAALSAAGGSDSDSGNVPGAADDVAGGASDGDSDNTSDALEGTSGDASAVASIGWRYLKSYTGRGFDAKTEFVGAPQDALTVHLAYETGDDNKGSDALFNYGINEDWYTQVNQDSDSVSRRMYTSVGWSYYLLYQDYEYGIKDGVARPGANYTDLREYGDISNLFSRSTYIQVTDRRDTYELPSAGGEGTQLYVLAGVALLAVAAGCSIARRRACVANGAREGRAA